MLLEYMYKLVLNAPDGVHAGHVIPADHLLPLVLCKGPAGEDLEFSFQHRDKEKMVQLVQLVQVMCMQEQFSSCCCFVVVFFLVVVECSFTYDCIVFDRWEKLGVSW